jgi:hypothetical protein
MLGWAVTWAKWLGDGRAAAHRPSQTIDFVAFPLGGWANRIARRKPNKIKALRRAAQPLYPADRETRFFRSALLFSHRGAGNSHNIEC